MIKPKNLLIVRTDRIGDVVLSLPLAEIIKKNLPGCKVTFLLREYTKAIAENHPFIDNILLLKEKDNKIPIFENVKLLSKNNFDACIIVYPTFTTALIVFAARIKIRVGTGYRWYSALFNKKVYEHRKYALRHELEYNVNLLRVFGIEENVNFNNVNFKINVNDKGKEYVNELFKQYNIDEKKPIIIIHPGSGGSAVDLPPVKFKELTELIYSKLNANIILTGSKAEVELCNKLQVNNGIKNFAGLVNLYQLIALIDKSDIFISNSTGPIHVAAALGKFTIGFYPKLKACSFNRWGPYTSRRKIFTPAVECADCKREQCTSIDCMNTIKVTDIFDEVEKIYNLENK